MVRGYLLDFLRGGDCSGRGLADGYARLGTCARVAAPYDLFTTLWIYLCCHGPRYKHQPPCGGYTGGAVEWTSTAEHGMFVLLLIFGKSSKILTN